MPGFLTSHMAQKRRKSVKRRRGRVASFRGDVSKSLHGFIEHAYKKPSWIVATVVLTIVVGYLFTLESFPEQRAAISRKFDEVDLYKADMEVLVKSAGDYKRIVGLDVDFITTKRGIINELIESECHCVEKENIRNALLKINEINDSIAELRGKNKGIRFQSPSASAFATRIEDDNQHLEKLSTKMSSDASKFTAMLLSDFKPLFTKPSPAQVEEEQQWNETSRALRESREREMSAFERDLVTMFAELHAKKTFLELKVVGWILAAVYVVVYAVACFSGILNVSRKN